MINRMRALFHSALQGSAHSRAFHNAHVQQSQYTVSPLLILSTLTLEAEGIEPSVSGKPNQNQIRIHATP